MKTTFDNGFGVSVVTDGYGSDEGLLELAVITEEEELHYNNEVAEGDVRGYLTQKDVDRLTQEVKQFAKYVSDDDIYYNSDGTTTGKDQDV